MYLGHGAYGVEAASRLYFNKSNKQLTLEEAALIAGIFQIARAPEPVRRHEARHQRGATSCCSGWPTSATSRRRRPTPPSRSRSSRAAQPNAAAGHRAVLRRGSAQAPRAAVRREGAVRERPLGDDDARRDDAGGGEPGDRARAARATTSATASGKPKRNVLAERHTIDGFKDDRWNRPIARRRRRPRRRRHRAEDRAGAPAHRPLSRGPRRSEGYAWTRRDVGGRSVQAGRSHRRRGHEDRRGDRRRRR